MAQTTPDFILFDLDGTLSRLSPVITEISGAFEKFFYWIEKLKRNIKGRAKPKLETYFKQAISQDTPKVKRPRKSLAYTFMNAVFRPRPMEGVAELLHYLDSRDIETGVVSNGPSSRGSPFLHKFDLYKHFEASSFRHEAGPHKPFPDSLINTIERIKTAENESPATIWFVGDLALDMETAVNAQKTNPRYQIVPVAIGKNTSAARKLQKLHKRGKTSEGLIFENYKEMLKFLQAAPPPSL